MNDDRKVTEEYVFTLPKEKRSAKESKKLIIMLFVWGIIFAAIIMLIESILLFQKYLTLDFGIVYMDIMIMFFLEALIYNRYGRTKSISARITNFAFRSMILLLILSGTVISVQLVLQYFGVPAFGTVGFIVSEGSIYLIWFFAVTSWRFGRKTVRVNLQNPLMAKKDSHGNIVVTGKGKEWPQGSEETMQRHIKGKISDEEFFEELSGYSETAERLLNITKRIESRAKKRFRW